MSRFQGVNQSLARAAANLDLPPPDPGKHGPVRGVARGNRGKESRLGNFARRMVPGLGLRKVRSQPDAGKPRGCSRRSEREARRASLRAHDLENSTRPGRSNARPRCTGTTIAGVSWRSINGMETPARFSLMRTADHVICRFRADVPDELARRLEEPCRREPPGPGTGEVAPPSSSVSRPAFFACAGRGHERRARVGFHP